MSFSNVVSIRSLDINTTYDFTFTVNTISEDSVCVLETPSEFKYMSKDDVEMITSLLMSYYLSADVFVKSLEAKENNNLGFVAKELLGKKITLSICKNLKTGFSFTHNVPESVKGSAGELAIANSITALLTEFEETLFDDIDSETLSS